jgi:hypothetical protein
MLLVGVAAAAAILVTVAMTGSSSGLWFLLVLACPLMMLFMMGSMNHQAGSDEHEPGVGSQLPNLEGLTRDEQVQALRGEMTRINWRQATLRQEVERLERERAGETTTKVELH